MTLSPGTHIGTYEVVGLLGRGGMGEVYKARDTRLDRIVAIKVLSAELAGDPQFLERFDREARSISALNHPHICALYDIGQDRGINFLVLEHLEGESLATRLERGPLALEQALKLSGEIARALDKAHSQGIVHRDLKPGNVMLTKTGAKLLDFGLAKAAAPRGTATDLNAAPTRTTPLTQQGTILGTFQYMSPEQLEGRDADARSDIWALGCVIFEMVAGARAFAGKTHAGLIGAILKDTPPHLSTVAPAVPAALDHVVTTCLAKDPDDRWQSAGDIARELQWLATASGETTTRATADSSPRTRERAIWMAITTLLLLVAATSWWRGRGPEVATAQPTVRAVLQFPTAEAVGVNAFPSVALSPDGRYLAYRGGSPSHIHVRTMEDGRSRAIAGTEGALYPFFSPDSGSLGFLAGRAIKQVALGGGAPITVLELTTPNLRGVSWGDDGFVYYTPTVSAGLWRVPEAGGTPEQLTTPDFAAGEKTHRYPFVLPGSKTVLFMVGTSRLTSFEDARIEALSLPAKTRHLVVNGGAYPQFISTGHIVYTRERNLVAMAFDPETLAVSGSPTVVAEGMLSDPFYGMGNHGVSQNGVFVRIVGGAASVPQELLSVDRRGNARALTPPTMFPLFGRVSRDGTRYASYLIGATSQLSIFDLTRGTSERLTYEWDNESPVWSPDESRIAFVSNRGGGPRNLHWMNADGSGTPTRLVTSAHEQTAYAWSPDGTIAYTDTDPESGSDIWTVSIGGGEPAPLVKTPSDDGWPSFSPDGKWIAYQSSQSSQSEIYVQAFPNVTRRWQISTNGGISPLWRHDSSEIVFRQGNSIMAVPVTAAQTFSHGLPVKLFDTPHPLVDVLPDGRLLMRTLHTPPSVTELEVVAGWFSELRRRLDRQ